MEKKVFVSRVFNAPLEMVWRIWTEPELIKRWWGPDKFTCPVAELDFRVGGTSLVSMHPPQEFGGQDHYSIWHYTKIVPYQRIEFVQNLADEKGNKLKPTAVGMPPDFPEDILTVVTFVPLAENKTEMTITEHADMGAMSHFAQLGLEQTMGKMVPVLEEILNRD